MDQYGVDMAVSAVRSATSRSIVSGVMALPSRVSVGFILAPANGSHTPRPNYLKSICRRDLTAATGSPFAPYSASMLRIRNEVQAARAERVQQGGAAGSRHCRRQGQLTEPRGADLRRIQNPLDVVGRRWAVCVERGHVGVR